MFADRFADAALAELDHEELTELVRDCQQVRIQIDLLEAKALAAAVRRHPSTGTRHPGTRRTLTRGEP